MGRGKKQQRPAGVGAERAGAGAAETAAREAHGRAVEVRRKPSRDGARLGPVREGAAR
ncbi:hypothetical protein [Streptomyces sp. NPDC088762]|uniref:hypothetical protein n=1 Tax=Streptomyces sp. NPDC088762 TaxID=3365891 RepID=UPI00380EEE10